MQKSKKIYNWLLVSVSVFVMVVGSAFTPPPSDVNFVVRQTPDIDIMVTVGNTAQSLETFEDDLKSRLNAIGIDPDKVRVEAFKRSTVSSSSADAQEVFNNWTLMQVPGTILDEPTNPTGPSVPNRDAYFIFDTATQQIRNTDSSRPANALFDPYGNMQNGTIKADFGIPVGSSISVHGESGFIFRMKNKDEYYAYIIDNHSACGNISGYGSDGTPCEGVVKFSSSGNTLLALNTNSGNSGTATYGWNGSYPQMFDAYYQGQHISFKIEMFEDHISIWRKGGKADGSLDSDYIKVFDFNDSSYSSGSYGFYVWEQVGAYFSDISFSTFNERKYHEVLNEPEWRDNSLRFLVNLDDTEVSDFNNNDDLGIILQKTINEELHYVGWGTATNQAQWELFVQQNSGKGTFINRSSGTYGSQLDDMVTYIEQQINNSAKEGVNVLANVKLSITATPPEALTNTGGKWMITHDPTHFENNMGTVSWSGLPLDDVPLIYQLPGKYSFLYDGSAPTPAELYVHRLPIAAFTYSLSSDTYQDLSYDLDLESTADKGIQEYEWKWKQVEATVWNDGQFTKVDMPNGEYIIQLRVKDYQDAWSMTTSQFVKIVDGDTGPSAQKPVASFTFQPEEMYTYDTDASHKQITIVEKSSDPLGRAIQEYKWNVIKRYFNAATNSYVEQNIYTDQPSPMIDFSEQGAADYRISLEVKVDDGTENYVWSDPYIRTLSIIDDQTGPMIEATPSGGAVYNTSNILLTFSDGLDGSGASTFRYVVNTSGTPPVDGDESWSNWTPGVSKTLQIPSAGTKYLHVQVEDIAGNTSSATFGPYVVTIANQSPVAVDDTWYVYPGESLSLNVKDGSGSAGAVADYDPDGALTFNVTSWGALSQAIGAISNTNSNGIFTYTAPAIAAVSLNYNESTVFNYTITDNYSAVSSADVNLNIVTPTTSANGNYSNASTWTINRVPPAGSDVIVSNLTVMTFDQTVTVRQLTVNFGGEIRIANGVNLTVAGDLKDFNTSQGKIIIEDGGKLILQGDYYKLGNKVLENSTTLEINETIDF